MMTTAAIQVRADADWIVARFAQGSGVMESFRHLVHHEHLTSGVIVNGIGMLRDAKISYYDADAKSYRERTVEGLCELVSLQGNIGRMAGSGEVVVHAHATLADGEHRVWGGHLVDGTVWIANEVTVRRMDGVEFSRSKNEETNLLDLTLH